MGFQLTPNESRTIQKSIQQGVQSGLEELRSSSKDKREQARFDQFQERVSAGEFKDKKITVDPFNRKISIGDKKQVSPLFNSTQEVNSFLRGQGVATGRAKMKLVKGDDGTIKFQVESIAPLSGQTEKDKKLSGLLDQIAGKGGNMPAGSMQNKTLDEQIAFSRKFLADVIENKKSSTEKTAERQGESFGEELEKLDLLFSNGVTQAKNDFPGVGEEGFWKARVQGGRALLDSIANGSNPNLFAYNQIKKGNVSRAARLGGENGVLTNQDISRFAAAWMSIAYTDDENEMLRKNLIRSKAKSKNFTEFVLRTINASPIQDILVDNEKDIVKGKTPSTDIQTQRQEYKKLRRTGLSDAEARKQLGL